MSAILSADDLNDFISPSVACIKPVETLPTANDSSNPYEVTTEDAAHAANAPPAQISLTDCLACSGCVTSAEAVLVSLQSYQEVLTTLDAYPEIRLPLTNEAWTDDIRKRIQDQDGKIFVASVSPQARASIAATFGASQRAAGNMIQQLLSGDGGLRTGGAQGSGFAWVLDTNVLRDIALVSAADEVAASMAAAKGKTGPFSDLHSAPTKPILTSACPGWICYAEKTHPHVLPHISKLKSPQALTGTLIKSVLAKKLGISPDKIWHMAIMPCFDKKLEASREELTDSYWASDSTSASGRGIRDVDLVITSRELISLASARGIPFHTLPRKAIPRAQRPAFLDSRLEAYLFPRRRSPQPQKSEMGTSGGYLAHILRTTQLKHPGATISTQRGRNSDVVEYTVTAPRHSTPNSDGSALPNCTAADDNDSVVLLRAARYYGFRNIQNLVRRLRPTRASRIPGATAQVGRRAGVVAKGGSAGGVAAAAAGAAASQGQYDYVEVMACPGGCTNGGGQIRVEDVAELRAEMGETADQELLTGTGTGSKASAQKEWLANVDEAYFSASSGGDTDEDEDADERTPLQPDGTIDGHGDAVMRNGDEEEDLVVDGISSRHVRGFMSAWVDATGGTIDLRELLYTTYRQVESDVGKKKQGSDIERVAGLASSIGGGW